MEQSTELATGGGEALDAEELMGFSERIERLSPADAEWVTRLFDECHCARACTSRNCSPPGIRRCRIRAAASGSFDEQLAQVALDAAESLLQLSLLEDEVKKFLTADSKKEI